MTEKRPRNIHEIINRFDQIFGHEHIDIKVNNVSMDHIYLAVTYKKDHRVDPATAWGVCRDNSLGKITDLYAMVTVQLDQPDGPGRPRLILWRDAIHVNSFTMPEITMAQQFQRTLESMSSALSEKLFTHDEVLLGRTLHRQAMKEYMHRLEYMTRIANDFARTGTVASYALSEDTQEGQFREIMAEIQGLYRIGRYLQFQTDGNGRYVEDGKPMKGGAAA